MLYEELLKLFVMYLAQSWTIEWELKNNHFLPFPQHYLLLSNIIMQSVLLNIFLLALYIKRALTPLIFLLSVSSNPRIT